MDSSKDTKNYDEFYDKEYRNSRLSREEIKEIARELAHYQYHNCKFSGIEPEQLHAALRFYRHVDNLMIESGSTIRKTILVAGVGGLLSMLLLGIYSKIRTSLGM